MATASEHVESPLIELDDIAAGDDQAAVAAEIRSLMGRHKISQSRLAAALGMSSASFSERINGKSNFTIRELYRIARLFRVSVRELFPDERGIFDPFIVIKDAYNAGVLYVTKIEYPPEQLRLPGFVELPEEVSATPMSLGSPVAPVTVQEAA